MKNTGTEYKTMLGTFNSADGDLRLLNVTAGRGGKSYMSYQKVPQRLEDFCNWINAQRKTLSPDDIDKIYIAFITAVMLLILEVIRKCVGIAKAKGMKLFEKFQERKGANEADKKEN